VKRKYLPRIRTQVAHAKMLHAQLKASIEAHPELFEKPRTVTFHGVKVGFAKGKGKVTFQHDADKVIALIEKHLPDQAELLVITERKPNKDAIAQLRRRREAHRLRDRGHRRRGGDQGHRRRRRQAGRGAAEGTREEAAP
jgi:hypothetical protein